MTLDLNWSGDGQNLYLGTKNSDLIVGNWTTHPVKNLPLGASGFELTEITYLGE